MGTPRFIRWYREDLERFHFPRRLVAQVTDLVEAAGSRLDQIDKRPAHPSTPFNAATPLKAHQRAAVDAAVGHDLAVVVAPPGSGKTVTACAVIDYYPQPTLVLVDRKPLQANGVNG